MISRLHYITQDLPDKNHEQLAKEACEAGIDWIQLRIKNKAATEILPIALRVKEVCDQYKVKLIINDYVNIAKEVKAHGVHLGKEDMSAFEARTILGDNYIIGTSTNTFEDIFKNAQLPIDYCGLGPFKFTNTKEKLNPILGIEGYRKIMEQYLSQRLSVPIIVIGGITLNDIETLLQCSIFGVAISSYITNSPDKKNTIQNIKLLLNKQL